MPGVRRIVLSVGYGWKHWLYMYTIMLNVFDSSGSSSLPDSLRGITYEYDEGLELWYPVLAQAEVILRLLETFEDIIIGTQDTVQESAQVAGRILTAHGAAADNLVIASEYRRAKNVGPAHPFSFGGAKNKGLTGYVRRFDIKFCTETGFSVEMRDKINRFLGGFVVGEIEEYSW